VWTSTVAHHAPASFGAHGWESKGESVGAMLVGPSGHLVNRAVALSDGVQSRPVAVGTIAHAVLGLAPLLQAKIPGAQGSRRGRRHRAAGLSNLEDIESSLIALMLACEGLRSTQSGRNLGVGETCVDSHPPEQPARHATMPHSDLGVHFRCHGSTRFTLSTRSKPRSKLTMRAPVRAAWTATTASGKLRSR